MQIKIIQLSKCLKKPTYQTKEQIFDSKDLPKQMQATVSLLQSCLILPKLPVSESNSKFSIHSHNSYDGSESIKNPEICSSPFTATNASNENSPLCYSSIGDCGRTLIEWWIRRIRNQELNVHKLRNSSDLHPAKFYKESKRFSDSKKTEMNDQRSRFARFKP